VDSSLNTQWQHSICYIPNYFLYSVCQLADSNFAAGGSAEDNNNPGGCKAWFVKFTGSGDTLWDRVYYADYYTKIWTVTPTPDGGLIGSGIAKSSQADTISSIFLIRLDRHGDSLWTRQYQFPVNLGFNDLKPDPVGYVGTGWIIDPTNPGSAFPWLAHFSDTGDTLDFHIISTVVASSVRLVPYMGNQYLLAGIQNISGNVQGWVARCSNQGDLLWSQSYGDSLYDNVAGLAVDDSGYVYGAGIANSSQTTFYGWNFKLWPAVNAVIGNDPIIIPKYRLVSSPNPFNPSTTLSYELPAASELKLTVFDTAGRLVATLAEGRQLAGAHSVIFEGSDLPSGIYFARLAAGEFTQTQKLVLLK
jgi:hypothetical protein